MRPRFNSSAAEIAGDAMAISHELSSEIVAALLAAKERSPGELKDLKEILVMIHSTLQRLTDDAHAARVERFNPQAVPKQIAKRRSTSS